MTNTNETEWLRAYTLELFNRSVTDICRIQSPDPFAIGRGNSIGSVQFFNHPTPRVRIFASAARKVDASSKVFKYLNTVNTKSLGPHVYLDDGLATVEMFLHADGLHEHALANAIMLVLIEACDTGDVLVSAFDAKYVES